VGRVRGGAGMKLAVVFERAGKRGRGDVSKEVEREEEEKCGSAIGRIKCRAVIARGKANLPEQRRRHRVLAKQVFFFLDGGPLHCLALLCRVWRLSAGTISFITFMTKYAGCFDPSSNPLP
jgi:hypothetical protein